MSTDYPLDPVPVPPETHSQLRDTDTRTHRGVQPATIGEGPEGSRWGGYLTGPWGSLREDLPEDMISKISEA